MRSTFTWRGCALATLVATAATLAACGGSGGSQKTTASVATTPSTTPSAPTTPGTTTPATTSTPTTAGSAAGHGVRAGLVVGIGEQGSAMFADPRFRALGIKDARLVVAYDAVHVKFERQIVDDWLAQAKTAGVRPFVTFQHSRVHPKKLPSVAEFRTAFRAFHARYPQVQTYAPWNEVNHASQPTAKSPARAAAYYNVLKAECGGCTVLAGDVLDQPGMVRYLDTYRSHLNGSPRIWGLHNYADANRFRTSGVRSMLKAVRGDVWLTETGGIVRFGRNFPQSESRAARAVRYALGLASRTSRVKRIYLYNWTGAQPTDRFDAGLVGPSGATRPAYRSLLKALDG